MLTGDVSQITSVAKLIDEVLSKAGRTIFSSTMPARFARWRGRSSTAQAQALFDVNVFGVLRLTNAVLPAMAPAEGPDRHVSSVLV